MPQSIEHNIEKMQKTMNIEEINTLIAEIEDKIKEDEALDENQAQFENYLTYIKRFKLYAQNKSIPDELGGAHIKRTNYISRKWDDYLFTLAGNRGISMKRLLNDIYSFYFKEKVATNELTVLSEDIYFSRAHCRNKKKKTKLQSIV